jgi:hypothetical protein
MSSIASLPLRNPIAPRRLDGHQQSNNAAGADYTTANIARHNSRASKTNSKLSTPKKTDSQEINRIKAKAKLQKWELDQMAKKHDAEQKKKNDGAGVEVARKFMNYIEFGISLLQTFVDEISPR